MSMVRTVQTLVVNDGKILLGEWKRGPYKGRITGPMAWVNYGVRSEMAMRKEGATCVEKLTGIKLRQVHLERRAQLLFVEEEDPYGLNVEHVYMHDLGIGKKQEMMESDLMIPMWAPLDEIPYDRMPEDDQLWYPLFLKNRLLTGQFVFHGVELKSCKLECVDALKDPSYDHLMPFL